MIIALMTTLSLARPGSRALVGLSTLAIWALAAGCAVYWVLRLTGSGAAALAPASPPPAVHTEVGTVATALGWRGEDMPTASAPPAQATRFALQGVLREGNNQRGAALIGVDGQAAKPYPVGREVVDGLVVQSLSARGVVLAGSGGRELALEMPVLSEPTAVSHLPAATAPQSVRAVAPATAAATSGARLTPGTALGQAGGDTSAPAPTPAPQAAQAGGSQPALGSQFSAPAPQGERD